MMHSRAIRWASFAIVGVVACSVRTEDVEESATNEPSALQAGDAGTTRADAAPSCLDVKACDALYMKCLGNRCGLAVGPGKQFSTCTECLEYGSACEESPDGGFGGNCGATACNAAKSACTNCLANPDQCSPAFQPY